MLRPATDADKALVLQWRNQPSVREASLNSAEITPEQHDNYWQSLKGNPSRRVFMYELDGQSCGVATFFDIDPQAKSATWGYFLDNPSLDANGRLLTAWVQIQREAVELAFGELGLDSLGGEVLGSNPASLAMNKRNGFHVISSEERTIAGEPTMVHTVVRRRKPND